MEDDPVATGASGATDSVLPLVNSDQIDEDNEVIFCFQTEKTRLGIAVFEAATNTVSFGSQDFWGTQDLDWTLQRTFEQMFTPNVILTSRGIASSTENILRNRKNKLVVAEGVGAPAVDGSAAEHHTDRDMDSEVIPLPGDAADETALEELRIIKFLPKSSFTITRACTLLSRIQLEDGTEGESLLHSEEWHSDLKIRSLVDLEDKIVVQALGGLLGFLMESSGRMALDATGGKGVQGLQLRELKRISLSGYAHISTASFEALNIFSRDNHPSVIKGAGRAKEGFSLFALLDRTESSAGRKLLKQWMLRPLTDIAELNRRYDAVEQFLALKSCHVDAIKQLKVWLSNMKDMDRLIMRLSQVKATVSDWVALRDTVNSLCAITALAVTLHADLHRLVKAGERSTSETPQEDNVDEGFVSVFSEIFTVSGSQLQWVQGMLAKVVDWESSVTEGRLCVQHGLDSNLDEYRRTHADLAEFLSKIAVQEVEENDAISTASIAYIPQIGFLLCLDKADYPDAVALTKLSSLTYQYEVRDATYFKTARMRELDEFFGDIASAIIDMEDSITRQLEEKIIGCAPMLLRLGELLAEIDCLLSLADASFDMQYTRPELVEDNVVFVKGGRHPLQQVIVSSFVPNDTALAPGDSPGGVAIISGANFSGKSVYIKQTGLICYMAQIGCFVPAERAILGITDRFFTRIHTVDSTLRPESTFTMDVHQVAQMLTHSTCRSLLLIDEFGKGTSPVDGAALLLGIVEHLLQRRNNVGTPKVLITTHFADIFEYNLLTPAKLCELAFYQMEIHLERVTVKDAPTEWDNVTPLFRLIQGRTASSFGIACARQAGLPVHMLTRAELITEMFKRKEDIPKASGIDA